MIHVLDESFVISDTFLTVAPVSNRNQSSEAPREEIQIAPQNWTEELKQLPPPR
jgi:hypothetical protein